MSKIPSFISRISPPPRQLSRTRTTSTKRHYHSIRERAIHSAFDLSIDDIKALLWTAIELKALHTDCQRVDDIAGQWVAMLLHQDTYYLHSWRQAADLLDVNLTKTTLPEWESSLALRDIRRYYEINADMLLTRSQRHDFLKQLYAPTVQTNCKMPMFNMGSQQCALVCVLTDLMTYQSHFGRLLGLNMLWCGQVCTLINTYIPLAHTMSMNVRYCCHQMTPKVLQSTLKGDFGKSAKIREYNPVADADYKVDIVIVREDSPNWQSMMAMFKNHSPDMIILRAFPRTDEKQVIPEVLKVRQRHEDRAENLMYVMAAIMLRMLADYAHKTPEPYF